MESVFEFDPKKSTSNKFKHGIDFIEGQRIWNDDDLMIIEATSDFEPRWIMVGKIEEQYWTAVVTKRGETIRIISIRRSRTKEKTDYENEKKNQREGI